MTPPGNWNFTDSEDSLVSQNCNRNWGIDSVVFIDSVLNAEAYIKDQIIVLKSVQLQVNGKSIV